MISPYQIMAMVLQCVGTMTSFPSLIHGSIVTVSSGMNRTETTSTRVFCRA